MDRGQAPLMPAPFCRHAGPCGPLDADSLRVVWFEEGNGAALLDEQGILAIIPPWSGMGGFDGYARDCTGEGPVAWPLPDDPTIHDRVRQADEFWHLWDAEEFWETYRDAMCEPLEQLLGQHAKYYAIDGGNWPPRALLRFDLPQTRILVTVGMSLLPMPNVEMYADEPSEFRRVELGAVFDRRVPESDVARFGSYISGRVGFPWNAWTWLGDGHTINCDATPASCGGSQRPFALLTRRFAGAPNIVWPAFRGDPIHTLWFVPITEQECDLAVNSGSDLLRQRLATASRTAVIGPP
jgi:hypothetical protein